MNAKQWQHLIETYFRSIALQQSENIENRPHPALAEPCAYC